MHHVPFKMHWEKMRANIHMPRSVQYPGLCFFFFSPCTLSSFFYFFNKSIATEEKGELANLSSPLSFFPYYSRSKEEEEEERGKKNTNILSQPFFYLFFFHCFSSTGSFPFHSFCVWSQIWRGIISTFSITMAPKEAATVFFFCLFLRKNTWFTPGAVSTQVFQNVNPANAHVTRDTKVPRRVP